MFLRFRASFVAVAIILNCAAVHGWVVRPLFPCRYISQSPLGSTTTDDETTSANDGIKPSFYATPDLTRRGKPIFKPRKQLSEIRVGDALEGWLVQEHLEGVTGPKVFLECGIGRYNPQKQTWRMTNAMLRLGKRGTKASVARKRAARLKKKAKIECFVSRIRMDSGQLEVVLNSEDVPEATPSMVPVSSLKPGQEVVGTIQRLVPYGVFVDVGSNRNGLLHIQKVADLYRSYIDKEKGMKEAGLERGAKIKVQVESNDKKRIFLDFTTEVKEEAEKDRVERQKQKEEREAQQAARESSSSVEAVASVGAAVATAGAVASASSTGSSTATEADTSAEADGQVEDDDPYAEYANEEDPYAEYTANYQDGDDDYDEYDEDRDIEDSLGLGTY